MIDGELVCVGVVLGVGVPLLVDRGDDVVLAVAEAVPDCEGVDSADAVGVPDVEGVLVYEGVLEGVTD